MPHKKKMNQRHFSRVRLVYAAQAGSRHDSRCTGERAGDDSLIKHQPTWCTQRFPVSRCTSVSN